MTVFDNIKSKNIDELATWLDENCEYDGTLWCKWWDEHYCQNCESITAFVPYLNGEYECAYCEANGKCRFFQEMDHVPSGKEIVKMWLESEVEE
jgi:hypothetical protein